MLHRQGLSDQSQKTGKSHQSFSVQKEEILMHIPKKHRVEGVEKAIKDAKEHPEEPQMPAIKIIVNVGTPPMPMPMSSREPMRRKVMKAQKKVEKKGKKKGSRMAGKMEDALSGIY